MATVRPGKKFVRTAVSTSVLQIFGTTDNVAGAAIRTAWFLGINPNTTGTSIVLCADTAAPSGYGDLTKRYVFEAGAFGQSDFTAGLPYELELPPGWGLWAVADAANLWTATITYDLYQS